MRYGIRRNGSGRPAVTLALLVGIMSIIWPVQTALAQTQMRFGTPEAAVDALLTAFKNDDSSALASLFGAEYADRLLSKDKVAAREDRTRLYEAAQKKWTLRKDTADLAILAIGEYDWPFPIPLVQSGTEWRFYTARGIEEIENRRIGRNELNAIRVSQYYIWAQREYASKIRDGRDVRQFAQRLVSTAGRQDGLYWDPAVANGEESPFGPKIAEFLKSGHKVGDPYYGYYFRILTRQGKNAPGDRHNFLINGNMIAGFALVAFPAEYGNTGIMTFLVSHHGKVYQKDLGPRTAEIAKAMREYNPDATWTEVR